MSKEKSDKKRGMGRSEEEAPLSPLPVGKSWLFGIGINNYREFPKLNNAVKDVEDVRDMLLRAYDLTPECIFLLRNEEATRENIINRLDDLTSRTAENDKILIYYSGHGHLDNHQIGFWIPHDGERDSKASFIRNGTILENIRVAKARHILLISDSCFSGSLFMRGGNRSTRVVEELDRYNSRWAICSGRHDEEVYDGNPGENSPFAGSIIKVLDENAEPSMNVAKLTNRVVELTAAEYNQIPEGSPLFRVGHEGGQYIFRRKGVATPVIHSFVSPSPARPDLPEVASVWVNGGEFLMGDAEPDAQEASKPQHTVKISDFKIDTFPVTIQQFRVFVEASNYQTDAEKAGGAYQLGVFQEGVDWRHAPDASLRSPEEDNHPVVFVSWQDALAYAQYANKRLPTEAEWEYAARGGRFQDDYPFSGADEVDDVAWYQGNAGGSTHAVGLKDPNHIGLHDMSGLVWEWCADYYSPLYYANSATMDPRGPDTGVHRVLRGGSWTNPRDMATVVYRFSQPPDLISNCVGFRCVEDVNHL